MSTIISYNGVVKRKELEMIRKASLHDVHTTGVVIECPNCYEPLSNNDDPYYGEETFERWEGRSTFQGKQKTYGYCKNKVANGVVDEGCMKNDKPLRIDVTDALCFWWHTEGLTKNTFLLMERGGALRSSSLKGRVE